MSTALPPSKPNGTSEGGTPVLREPDALEIDMSEPLPMDGPDWLLIPMLQGCALPPTMFYCEECEMTYPKGWSDEESQAEMEANFPGLTKETGACVCDDCYKRIMGIEATP